MRHDEIAVFLTDAAAILRSAGVDSPRREARLLLAHVLGVEAIDIVTGRLPPITAQARAGFERAISRRAGREPLAYIVGVREFWSLNFSVGRGVLIPRPESETLVEEALRRFPDRDNSLQVLDLGTGSGCLLLAFLSERPDACGTGIDVSREVLEVAQKNAQSLGLSARSEFTLGDWCKNLSGRFDAVFVNPPYIPSGELASLAPEVGQYEPAGALDGGIDGLGAYRDVASGLFGHLSPRGYAFFEIGRGQGEDVGAILTQNGFALAGTVCDLAGIPRCLVAAEVEAAPPKKELALATRSG